MKKIGKLFLLLLSLSLVSQAQAASFSVRIKDIAHVLEARDNQLMGFGLVVGLRNTGDQSQTGFTNQALTNLMSRMGVVPQSVDFKSRNTAAVMVTATLPPFVRQGQKIDVTVSSVGDATSLQDGTLLITQLQGVDGDVYAVAQGSVIVGMSPSTPTVPYVKQNQLTAGRVPGGALVEKEVPVSIGSKGALTIVLNDPDFTTANRIANTISNAGIDAAARDAGTVNVAYQSDQDLVALMARVENMKVVPDAVAKVVVNERTGTVVIGENVKISPTAVSYAGIDVLIGDISLYSEGTDFDTTQDDSRYRARTLARLKRSSGRVDLIEPGTSLSTLVRALNVLGASPKDLISILQSMKKAGAINAEIEVI